KGFEVVGPIEQRKVGPLAKYQFSRREVDRIECADDNGRHEFYCISPDGVSTGRIAGIGSYLEDHAPIPKEAHNNHEWMAYRVNNLAIDKPHLLVVEYPDTDDMTVGITLMHPIVPPDIPRNKAGARMITPKALHDYYTAKGLAPGQSYLSSMTCGYITGNGYPVTGKRQSMSAVFYPGDDFAIVQFDNYSYMNPKPMRLCRLVVYEILNDLPMVEAPHLANDRIFGHYDEGLREPLRNFAAVAMLKGEMAPDGVMAPLNYYKWYYVAAERLVKYLRFRGENTWFPGVVRYAQSAGYPSAMAPCEFDVDIPALFALMFEENNLTLVAATAYMPTFGLRLQDRYTPWDVANGADTPIQVTGTGAFGPPIWGAGRVPNPAHPIVRRELAAMAGEMARRYRDYPAVKGVMLLSSPNEGSFQPGYYGPIYIQQPSPGHDYDTDCYVASYDDFTMRLFKEQTGIGVPVGNPRDPKRFAERKAWLLAHQKEAWDTFRCQVIADTWETMGQAVKRECPRMELYTGEMHVNATVAYAATNRYTSLAILRQMSAAVAAPRQAESCVNGYCFMPMNGDCHGFWGRIKPGQLPRWNAINTDPSTDMLLENNDRVGGYLGRAFFELWSRPYPPERPWYTTKVHSCRYVLAGNRGTLLDYAVMLSRCTPLFVCHEWVDGSIPQGHDEQFREFGSAYRAIPLGNYRTVFREEYPGVTVRSASEGDTGKTYFYAVNTDSRPRSVEIKTSGKLAERTSGYSTPARKRGRWPIVLAPYALRVFEIAGGKVEECRP
ncbi:MAG: hypothetical protein PHR35_20525, partial [Kiritimatiellae bacterium]|nr:hypothetical protein [Kiritimatiellia bacterium]